MSESVRVALTFDAEHPSRPKCPAGNSEVILDTLQAAGVRATFFVEGRWASAYPSGAARMAADGHLIGNHSHFHAELPLLSDNGLRTDVARSEETIYAVTGADPRPWFRCPYGAGHDDRRIVSTLADLGYQSVFWHTALDDWEPARTAGAIAEDAVAGARSHGDGAVILLHTWPRNTAVALPVIVERLDTSGARLVGLDELDTVP